MMTIIGKEPVDYVSKKTNRSVVGVKLHCAGRSDRVDGEVAETIFISANSPMYAQCLEYPVGTKIKLSYNRYGSVETIESVK